MNADVQIPLVLRGCRCVLMIECEMMEHKMNNEKFFLIATKQDLK
jgi:hypothetical protein